MTNNDKTDHNLKLKAIHELHLLIVYTLFLWIMLAVFNIYERFLLNNFNNQIISYGYSFIEALILAKIIIIGEALSLGKRWDNLPLIYAVIYKTFIFSLFVLIFMFLEHFIMGYLHKHTLAETYHEIMTQKINIMLAKIFIMFIIFIQFFSILELGKILGNNRLYKIFFTRLDATPDL
jgi:hypothetical protein